MKNDIQIINLKGFKCPLPVLKLRKRISQIHKPCKIQVIVDDPLAIIDIPAFCQQRKYKCECRKKINGDILCDITIK